jgi:hypothetical protein
MLLQTQSWAHTRWYLFTKKLKCSWRPVEQSCFNGLQGIAQACHLSFPFFVRTLHPNSYW